MDSDQTRLNLIYKGGEIRDVITEIQHKGHHGTMTDAVATALRFYQRMLRERDAGNRVLVHGAEGTVPVQVL